MPAPRLLLVREREDAERTAARLAAIGCEGVILPLFETRRLDPEPPDGPFAAILATSRHAVPWLAARFAGFGGPVLAVGEASADALRRAGFADVRAGPGRAGDLAPLADALPRRAGERFLYAAGRVRLPDLERGFAERGLPLAVAEVYAAEPLEPSRRDLAALLGRGPLDGVLLLSREQARALAGLLARAPALLSPEAPFFCLSASIALELPPRLGARTRLADAPRLERLLALVERWNETPDRSSFRCDLHGGR